METKKWEVEISKDSNGYVDLVCENLSIATFYGGFERTIPNATMSSCAPEMLKLLQEIAKENVSKHYFKINELIKKATTI